MNTPLQRRRKRLARIIEEQNTTIIKQTAEIARLRSLNKSTTQTLDEAMRYQYRTYFDINETMVTTPPRLGIKEVQVRFRFDELLEQSLRTGSYDFQTYVADYIGRMIADEMRTRSYYAK
jgi:hypothetical protein